MVQSTNGKGGKGSDRRLSHVSRAEYDLRWDYAQGWISEEVFNRRLKSIPGHRKKK